MLITEAVESFLALMRSPLTEASDPEVHAAYQAALEGDNKAFETLYNHFYPMLVRVAQAHLKEPDRAEDVVQTILAKIHTGEFKEKHSNIESAQGITGLFVRSVLNLCKNANRKLKHRSKESVGTDVEGGEIEPQAKQDDDVERGEMQRVVRSALDDAFKAAKLDDKERQYVMRLIGSEEGLEDVSEHGRMTQLAQQIWPEKAASGTSNIRVYARRVKERFLKHLCKNKELLSLLPPGKVGGLCGEADETITAFALGRMLVEDAALDADTIYDAVLRWIGEVVSAS